MRLKIAPYFTPQKEGVSYIEIKSLTRRDYNDHGFDSRKHPHS